MRLFSSIFLTALLFISCKKEQEIVSASVKEEKVQKQITFKTKGYTNEALILSDRMDIYNTQKEVVGSIKGLYGCIVDIENISTDKYDLTNSDDNCLLHNFVKVKSPKVNGWVYGRDIYEYAKERDTTFTLNGVDFRLIPTRNFDIGVSDDAGLTFCGDHSPLVVYNSKFNRKEFIPVNDKKSPYGSKYLVLDDGDGWIDKIKEASLEEGDILLLNILREYQEGSANFVFEVHLKPEGTYAIIKEYTYHEPI